MENPLFAAFDLEFQRETYLDPTVSKSIQLNSTERFLKLSHNGVASFALRVVKGLDSAFSEVALNIELYDGELVLMPSFSDIQFQNGGLNLTRQKEQAMDGIALIKSLQEARNALLEIIDWVVGNEVLVIDFMTARKDILRKANES